jgi:hypothetical protein
MELKIKQLNKIKKLVEGKKTFPVSVAAIIRYFKKSFYCLRKVIVRK